MNPIIQPLTGPLSQGFSLEGWPAVAATIAFGLCAVALVVLLVLMIGEIRTKR